MADQTQILDGISYGAKDTVGDGSRYSYEVHLTSGSINSPGTTEYTEGDTDASITGTAIMWEDTSDTLRAVSVGNSLPVNVTSGSITIEVGDIQIGAVEIKDHDSTTRLDVETVTSKNALFDQSEDGAHVAIGATDDAVVAAGAVGSVSAKLRRLTTDTDAIKTAVEAIDNTIYDEDSPHTTEDDGTFVLAVRNDSGSVMSDTSGDYTPFMVDANGRLYVNTEVLDKDTDEVLVWANTVKDGTGTDYVPLVDADGHLQVDVLSAIVNSGSINLFANDGVDIGDVDVASVPAPLNIVGGGAEAAALRVTIANDSTGVVSVDDNGSSLTVDGTVTVSSGSVAVTSIQDGGNSLTVDQSTHDNFNANANIQVGDADVANGNPVPVSDAGGSLTVDGTVAVSSGSVDVTSIAAGDNNIGNVDIVTGPTGASALEVQGTAADGAAVAGDPVQVGGKDGSGNAQSLTTDTDGHLQVDVLSSTTTVSSGSIDITAIAAGDENIGNVDIVTVPAPLNVVGGGAEATALRVTLANDSTGVITVDDGGSSLTVDGTVAVSSGSVNLLANDGVDIGDIDVASMPADTFVAEDGSLGKGVLIQGDDGTDRHNLQTDANGYLKTIAQAADGVDIGDVDVASVGALEQTTPTFYNKTLTSADTEYIQALPANTRALQFQCRTAYDVRYAFETGKVAAPTSPYSTLKNPSIWYKENILTSGSLYLASSQAGVIVEIETWS